MTTDDPLAPLREQIAAEHLGDKEIGDRLRGLTEEELRADAERLREQAQLTGTGRPSLAAAVFAHHADVAARNERVLGGWSEKGAPSTETRNDSTSAQARGRGRSVHRT